MSATAFLSCIVYCISGYVHSTIPMTTCTWRVVHSKEIKNSFQTDVFPLVPCIFIYIVILIFQDLSIPLALSDKCTHSVHIFSMEEKREREKNITEEIRSFSLLFIFQSHLWRPFLGKMRKSFYSSFLFLLQSLSFFNFTVLYLVCVRSWCK